MKFCIAFWILLGFGIADSQPSSPRNVVFLLADDLGYGELGCYGQEKIRTPHLDRLAREGVRFTQHYSGAPVCAPSRCVLLTGKHLGHAEIRGNRQARLSFPQYDEGQHPLSGKARTIAKIFQEAGYATAAFGKWGLGPVGTTGEPAQQGFDHFFGYNCQAVAHSYYPRFLWKNSRRVEINPQPVPGHARQPEGEIRDDLRRGSQYAPDLITEEAIRFIHTNRSKPFFLYLPFVQPHVSLHPPQTGLDAYPETWDSSAYRGESGYLPHSRPRAAYAALISELDRHVGKIRAALEKAGVLDHTLLIFTSDNGTTHEGRGSTHFHVGGVDAQFFESTGGLKGYKGSVHEGGIRVPLMVRLPGAIHAGSVNHSPSYFADWFPTLCEAAGLPAPEHLDGESLWPAIIGGQLFHRSKPMVWFFPEYGGQAAVRIGTFKILKRDLLTQNPAPWEVYDLSRDAGETADRSASKRDLIQQAARVLREQVGENDLFPLPIPSAD